MVKKIEWKVVCPECGYHQTYHSHNKSVKGSRRKSCERCSRSFKAKDQRLENITQEKRRLRKEKEKKGDGFFNYTRGED